MNQFNIIIILYRFAARARDDLVPETHLNVWGSGGAHQTLSNHLNVFSLANKNSLDSRLCVSTLTALSL